MRVFELALKGFNDLEIERAKREWEQTRFLGSWILAPYRKKGDTPLTPQRLLPFEWDPKPETREQWLEKNKHLKSVWDKLEKAK